MFKIKIFLSCLLFAMLSGMINVYEYEQVLVLRLGKVVNVIDEPGLSFKIPLLDNILFYDKRTLEYIVPAQELITGDQERIVVNAMVRYKIINPLKYYQTVRDESGVKHRLMTLIKGGLRVIIAKTSLKLLLSKDRGKIMEHIRDEVRLSLSSLGLELVDLRIGRVELPEANSKAIYKRMQSTREIMAKELRTIGLSEATKIRSQAEKDAQIIIAQANATAFQLRSDAHREVLLMYQQFDRGNFFEVYMMYKEYARLIQNNLVDVVFDSTRGIMGLLGN